MNKGWRILISNTEPGDAADSHGVAYLDKPAAILTWCTRNGFIEHFELRVLEPGALSVSPVNLMKTDWPLEVDAASIQPVLDVLPGTLAMRLVESIEETRKAYIADRVRSLDRFINEHSVRVSDAGAVREWLTSIRCRLRAVEEAMQYPVFSAEKPAESTEEQA